MYTVKTLKAQLEKLIAQGLGDRIVVFPVLYDADGYDGDYALVSEVDTKDSLELVVYLECYNPEEDSELWSAVEAKAKKS
jgi:hypothetical protein